MPLKISTPSNATPRTLPEAVSAIGPSSARATADVMGVAASAPSEVEITVRRFGMVVPFQLAAAILDPIVWACKYGGMSRPKRIVICGGGAIGVSLAYFLSRQGAEPVVIERHEVAGAASGKSVGFLALDVCRGSALDRLARRSFRVHAELADALGNPWGYRTLETYAGHAAENGRTRGAGPRPWLSASVTLSGRLGSPQTTALVEPRAFTTGLMRAAEAQGAALRPGAVVELARSNNGAASGVVVDRGETVEGDGVVIALGPWSILATRWVSLPAVYGFKGHSVVFNSSDSIPAEALFLEYREASGETLSPELFPRADGTTWVCAISSTGPLP